MAENHHVALIGPRVSSPVSTAPPAAVAVARGLRPLAGPTALLLILVLAFWKITLTGGEYTWLESPDLAEQVMPWLQYEASELHRGNIPFWDPHEWAGQSLIGQAQPSLANPLSWPLFAAPLDRGWLRLDVLTAWFVFIHFCGGLFCYLLCRDLGRSEIASVLGGTTFALGGWFGRTDWPQMISGAVWAPLIFLFLLRALRLERPIRNAALSGSMLGLAFLSGHHQIPIFTGLAAGGCWIYFLSFDWKAPFRWASVAAFGAMAGLTGAIQILPASAYGKLAVRWVGSNYPVHWNEVVPYRVHEYYSLAPASMMGALIHTVTSEPNVYLGGTILLLAVLGVVLGWKRQPVRVLAAVAVGGMLFSFGRWTVFHGILYSLLPEIDKARHPSYAIFLFAFAAAPLAAFGFDLLAEASEHMRRIAIAALATAAALFLFTPWLLMQTKLPRTVDFNLVAWYGFTFAALAIVLAVAWRRSAGLALLAVALAEFSPSISYGNHRAPDVPLLHKLRAHAQIAGWLGHQPGPVRVETDEQEIAYNFSDWYGIDQYWAVIPTLTMNVDSMRGNYWGRMVMGVNYWIGRKPLRNNQKLVFTGANGVNVYRNEDAFPRAWAVHRAFTAPAQLVDATLNATGASLREQAFFAGAAAPKLESCTGDTVDVLRRDPDSITVDAAMNCKGLVVVGEDFDPGWRARVDGRSAPVLEADGVARAVVVPGGHHRIVMRYRPPSILLGLICSGTGFALTLALLFI